MAKTLTIFIVRLNGDLRQVVHADSYRVDGEGFATFHAVVEDKYVIIGVFNPAMWISIVKAEHTDG